MAIKGTYKRGHRRKIIKAKARERSLVRFNRVMRRVGERFIDLTLKPSPLFVRIMEKHGPIGGGAYIQHQIRYDGHDG